MPYVHRDKIITSSNGSMIPHRLLNPAFFACRPQIIDIIFPECKDGEEVLCSAVSPAKRTLYLLQSHVNARNLDGHGVADLSAMTRCCRSYRLTYGSFADLEAIFNKASGLFV